MNALMHAPYGSPVKNAPATVRYEDPLDEDVPTDLSVLASRRALTRLAFIAAETGARFQREGGALDPMSWMLAPRLLFGGGAAIDAVLRREHFLRALLLHGLSIGLDADPAFIDGLMFDDRDDDDHGGGHHGSDRGDGDDDDDMNEEVGAASAERGGWFVRPRDVAAIRSADLVDGGFGGEDRDGDDHHGRGGAGPRLITATLVHHDGRSTLHAFHASVCADPLEAYERIAFRYGQDAARDAELSVGFDPTTTFAEALVSPAMSELLQLVDAEPGGSLAAGLDLNLEQRFDA